MSAEGPTATTNVAAPMANGGGGGGGVGAPVSASVPSGGGGAANMQRMNNIQRIQLRKQQVREWPRSRKLEKLAVYSSCKNVVSFPAVLMQTFH